LISLVATGLNLISLESRAALFDGNLLIAVCASYFELTGISRFWPKAFPPHAKRDRRNVKRSKIT
jgi:hypothetical protein